MRIERLTVGCGAQPLGQRGFIEKRGGIGPWRELRSGCVHAGPRPTSGRRAPIVCWMCRAGRAGFPHPIGQRIFADQLAD
jgi:hypothetical protein